MTTWDAGARSVTSLKADGWFSFEIDAAATGVAAGLNTLDGSTHYNDIEFGFQFSQGRWRAIQSGSAVTGWAGFPGERETFHVARGSGKTYLLRGTDAPSFQGGSPIRLPGTLLYTFNTTSVGAAFLDASILTPLDSIYNLTMTDAPVWGRVDIGFPAMELIASVNEYAQVGVSFAPMTLSATYIGQNSASVSFDPMRVYSAEGERAGVDVRFAPMTLMATAGSAEIDITSANISLPPMVIAASGDAWTEPVVDLSFEPMQLAAFESASYAGVYATLPPMFFYAEGATPYLDNYFLCILPAVTYSVDSAFDGLTSVGYVSSDYTIIGDPEFTSLGLADSTATPSADRSIEVTGTSTAVSVASPSYGIIATSEAEGFSEVELLVENILTSLAVGTGEVELLVERSRELVSEAVASSAATVDHGAEIESLADATSAVDLQAEVLLESLAEALSEVALVGDGDEVLLSAGVVDSTYWIETETDIAHTSLAHATSQYSIKNPGAIAWVMNTETAAPSWYSNWQFIDMIQIGNRVLAVGPEGLVELGAATDNGDDIDAGVTYGFSDFGSDFKKRIDSFWFGYTSDDVLEASVETLGNPVYTYSMTPRDAEQPRNNRIRPGKGLNARYWRVGINNVGGCAFDVDSIAADVVQSARRL